jgi:hypothetical protein
MRWLYVYLALCLIAAIGVPLLIWRVHVREARGVSQDWLYEHDTKGDR